MKFLYVHFPKAGGTSLSSQLLEHFGERSMVDYDHAPLASHLARTPATPPENIECVLGHLHPARYANWADSMFTILREPIDNLISIYFFWKDLPPSGVAIHEKFLRENPSIEEFAGNFPLKRLFSEEYFGEFDMRRFDFIGFYEERETAFSGISNLLGKNFDFKFYINKTNDKFLKERENIKNNPRIMQNLKDSLKNDIYFYERVMEKWM